MRNAISTGFLIVLVAAVVALGDGGKPPADVPLTHRQAHDALAIQGKEKVPWKSVVGKRVTVQGIAWHDSKGLGERVILDGTTMYINSATPFNQPGRLVEITGTLAKGHVPASRVRMNKGLVTLSSITCSGGRHDEVCRVRDVAPSRRRRKIVSRFHQDKGRDHGSKKHGDRRTYCVGIVCRFCVFVDALRAKAGRRGPATNHRRSLQPLTLDQLVSGQLKVIDLGWALNDKNPYWPAADYEPFRLKTIATLEKNGVLSKAFYCPEHLGTHLDAPNHFEKNQPAVEQIEPANLFAHGVVIDVATQASADADYRLTTADIAAWGKNEWVRIPDKRGGVPLDRLGQAME